MKATILFLCLTTLRASAQYAIDWLSIDDGGGQSSSGVYAISGTVGQSDAGVTRSNRYALQGGFWSVWDTVSAEAAPALRIVAEGQNILLAWPYPSTGFALQESPSLSQDLWSDVIAVSGVVGQEKQVSQSVAPGTRFYRLRRP